MTAFSIALAYLGTLAAVLVHRHVASRASATLMGQVASLSLRLDALTDAHQRSDTAAHTALADLVNRVRSCELKAGIRGVPTRPAPPPGIDAA